MHRSSLKARRRRWAPEPPPFGVRRRKWCRIQPFLGYRPVGRRRA